MQARYQAVLIVLLWPALFPLGLRSEDEPLPEGKGKEIVSNVCNQCHGLQGIRSTKRTREEWRDVVTNMVSNGAALQENEAEIVVEYLAEHFGRASSSGSSAKAPEKGQVNVNKATAKEWETELGLSAQEAAAVVAYREEHGNFKAWEELKKVPGLDAKKIEDAKDRLVF